VSNYNGIHHAGVLCQDISKSIAFYRDVLGMVENDDRPDSLPYKGAWMWVGWEMIHLMELPNPDPSEGRPEHGGRDRHLCVSVEHIAPIEKALKKHGVEYTKSKSGRAAIFFRDPDDNVLEMAEMGTPHKRREW